MEINSSLVCRLKRKRMRSLPSGALQPTFSHHNEKKRKKTNRPTINEVCAETMGELVKKIGNMFVVKSWVYLLGRMLPN